MLAISLWQPWASLWVSGRKVHETRHWRTLYRGWLIVHAGKRFDKPSMPGDPLNKVLVHEFGDDWAIDLPRGALIGQVHIADCVSTCSSFGDVATNDEDRLCGDFSAGRFAWRADDFQAFKEPIAYRGAQGFFRIPEGLVPG
jgi:activating signal cointegrator 1